MPRAKAKTKTKTKTSSSIKRFNTTVIVWLVFVVLLEISIIVGIKSYQDSQIVSYVPPTVLSFQDCERAGYPVMESFPRRCAVPNGQTYTEEIVVTNRYVNASVDDINVILPASNAVTGKKFTIVGEVQSVFLDTGTPFFVVYDTNDKIIARGELIVGQTVNALGFFAFEGVVDIQGGYVGEATIHVKKAIAKENPVPSHRVEVDVVIR